MNGNGGPAPEELTEIISDETARRLRRLAGRVPPSELSEIWVFPPLDDVEGSDEFHLFTRRVDEGVFRVCAAEFAPLPDDASADGGTNGNARVTVYGAVPESRVSRLVANFRDRLGDGREPLHLPIFGSLERWRLAVGADPEEVEREEVEPADVESAEVEKAGGAADASERGSPAMAASG